VHHFDYITKSLKETVHRPHAIKENKPPWSGCYVVPQVGNIRRKNGLLPIIKAPREHTRKAAVFYVEKYIRKFVGVLDVTPGSFDTSRSHHHT
jgi:hypothetical protein